MTKTLFKRKHKPLAIEAAPKPDEAKPAITPLVASPWEISRRQEHTAEVPVQPKRQVDAGDAQHQARGQSLLRRLEQGAGPDIEIAWPASSDQRSRLFRHLHDCEGVRVARLYKGRLEAVEGKNLEEMSGFVRVVSGQISAQERDLLNQLPGRGSPVRLFPRSSDAALLGALSTLVGPAYEGGRRIRGHYQYRDGQLLIDRITIDGGPVKGSVRYQNLARQAMSSSTDGVSYTPRSRCFFALPN